MSTQVPEIPEQVLLDIDSIQPDPLNPNVEDLGTFNELVEAIKEDGFIEPVVVSPLGDGMYVLVGGEHRWKAAKLAGMRQVPAIVKEGWDEDERRIRLIRLNALRGKLDPERFTKLYLNLKRRFGEEGLRKRLGFGSRHDAEIRRLVKSMEASLPEHMRDELKRRADRIRSVEDLAAIVQSLFAKYGGTIDSHFVLFSFGGKTHLMIRAESATFAPIAAVADLCLERGLRFDRVLATMVQCQCEQCTVALEAKEATDGTGGAEDQRDGSGDRSGGEAADSGGRGVDPGQRLADVGAVAGTSPGEVSDADG